mgnify:FL=1
MADKKLITPRKLQGFWELMPNEELVFEDILDKLKNVFKNNCFLPLDTPNVEYSEILLAKSGGDLDKEIYRFTKGDNDICLRYDLTVPLARFVSMNYNILDFPFKRFQIGKVYRGERPQKGRFREFYQCDADIIGESLPLTYDAECIKLYEPCFKALNLETIVEISNRKILAGFFESLGLENKTIDLMIVVDKVDKLSKDDIISLLKENGLNDNQIDDLFTILNAKGSFKEIKNKIKNITDNSTFQEGLSELEIVNSRLQAMRMRDDTYCFNLAIVRGHNYYTGTVFEAYIKGKRNLGAIGGGGRYDNLCGHFIDKQVQGVGMSIGITRLFDILRTENMIDFNTSSVDVGIITFDEETLNYGLSLMTELRENGIKADVLNEEKSFKAKMKEANRKQIPFIIICGEDELKSNTYTLKNMETSTQVVLPLSKIIQELNKK